MKNARGGGSSSARRWLEGAVRRLKNRVHPRKVVLFGSYAYGKPSKESDLDLLVIVDSRMSREKRYAWVDRAIGEHIWPIDLLVRNPNEVAARVRIGDPFFMDILKRGRVLYES